MADRKGLSKPKEHPCTLQLPEHDEEEKLGSSQTLRFISKFVSLQKQHGRLKVKTTAEQQEAKRKEREKKLMVFREATQKVTEKRTNKEYDQEALEVTGQLLAANPDIYSLWNYRREIFVEWKQNNCPDLQKVLCSELQFVEQCLRYNPKGYSAWHQRCWVMDFIPDPDWKQELHLCNKYLELDERNFHCWDYRRFVVDRYKVSTADEFDFTTTKISTNFSNYSSWHYRSKLLPRLHPDPLHPVGVSEEILLQEFELAQNAFFTDPNDQSAWFYHRWLLGRGEKSLAIECCHISMTGKIVLVLTKPAKVGHDFNVSLSLSGSTVEVTWTSPSNLDYSSLWTTLLDKANLPLDKPVELIISLDSSDSRVTVLLEGGASSAYWKCHHKPGTRFSYELSAATSSTLLQELESCQQLHELEPDNKWTLLTIVSLMRAVDPLKYEAETLDYIKKLIEVDPLRRNYYNDLRSKFIIENAIEQLPASATNLTMCGRGLSVLYHMTHLVTMETFDFSNNDIPAASTAYLLQGAKSLNMNNNQLCACDGIRNIDDLEELSLENNCIRNVGDLQDLTTCEKLRVLKLQGNPLCSLPNYQEDIRELLPHIEVIT